MFDFLKTLFSAFEEKKETREDVINKRQETKNKLAKNLKEKLFFTDAEIYEVLTIIDNSYMKIDMAQNSVQYSDNYGAKSGLNFDMELLNIQKEMKENITNKIKEIMAEKLKKAKEHFGKS